MREALFATKAGVNQSPPTPALSSWSVPISGGKSGGLRTVGSKRG